MEFDYPLDYLTTRCQMMKDFHMLPNPGGVDDQDEAFIHEALILQGHLDYLAHRKTNPDAYDNQNAEDEPVSPEGNWIQRLG